jgi:hypothetical protein
MFDREKGLVFEKLFLHTIFPDRGWVGGGMVGDQKLFVSNKIDRVGGSNPFVGCFLFGKERGDVWPRARDRATQHHDGLHRTHSFLVFSRRSNELA